MYEIDDYCEGVYQFRKDFLKSVRSLAESCSHVPKEFRKSEKYKFAIDQLKNAEKEGCLRVNYETGKVSLIIWKKAIKDFENNKDLWRWL